jgi:hypothetical protein
MPTTTSLLAFVAQRLRVAASFNRPITSALDQINADSCSGIVVLPQSSVETQAEPMRMSQIRKGAAFLHHRNWDDFWHNLNPKNR